MKLHEDVKKWIIEMKITDLLLGSGLTREEVHLSRKKKKTKEKIDENDKFFSINSRTLK